MADESISLNSTTYNNRNHTLINTYLGRILGTADLYKDFYRNGRNTRFWLVALRGKDFGIKTLTIAHQTQSIFIKL